MNNHYSKIQLTFFLLLVAILLRGQGLLWEDAPDTLTPRLPLVGFAKGTASCALSLKDYCPSPFNQGALDVCGPVALGYAAYSIRHRLVRGDGETFSAAYIFNKNNRKSIKLSEAVKFMRDTGICREKTYSNNYIFKFQTIPQNATEEAKKNKADIVALGCRADSIKIHLEWCMPVVVNAKVEDNFINFSPQLQNFVWNPSDFLPTAHALTFVGYNKGYFEVMNSYGDNWGNKGFFKIHESNVSKICAAPTAYAFGGFKKGSGDTNYSPSVSDSAVSVLMGSFQLHYVLPDDKNSKGGDSLQQVKVEYDELTQTYRTKHKDWRLRSAFQFQITRMLQGGYLYIFSIGDDQQLTVHWPPDPRWAETHPATVHHYTAGLGRNPISALIVPPNFTATLPAPDSVWQAQSLGTEQVVVLIADRPIEDFHRYLNIFKGFEGTATARLQRTFGDSLIPNDQLVYQTQRLWFYKPRFPKKGWIAPLVLTVPIEKE